MSKSLPKKEYKYSKIQYFFWLLSGAEISVLKDCPTDYNRQAGIGFTIFMTTLLAFCSGSYAGWFFGEKYTIAFIFGLIWSTLIFSIDRSMVITMKKDPTKEKQNFWLAFLTRAVLAVLIAFVISIPLELLIFKDNIEIHKPEFVQNKILTVIDNQKIIEGTDDIRDRGERIDNELTEVQDEGQLAEPKNNPTYDKIKKDLNKKVSEKETLRKRMNDAILARQNAWAGVPSYFDTKDSIYKEDKHSNQYRQWEIKRNEATLAKEDFNSFDQAGLDALQKQRNDYLNEWREKLTKKGDILENDKEANRIRDSIAQEEIIRQRAIMDSLLARNQNGFVFNFMVLEDAAKKHREVLIPIDNADSSIIKELGTGVGQENSQHSQKQRNVIKYDKEGATIFFLLWLIRFLFFTIEILPTITKIATPLGAYDRAIYQKEEDLRYDLEHRTEEYLEQQKVLREVENLAEQEQVKERVKIENQLHKDLLTEIAKAQEEVARQKIEEFRQQHLNVKQNGIQIS